MFTAGKDLDQRILKKMRDTTMNMMMVKTEKRIIDNAHRFETKRVSQPSLIFFHSLKKQQSDCLIVPEV